MQTLLPQATETALLLKQRKQTIAVAESSTGGLISAALLAVAGALAYFLGGATVYTRLARRVLLDIPDTAVTGIRYGDSAGHSCVALAGGGGFEQAITIETGEADRLANMRAFARAAMELLQRTLAA